MTQYGTWVSYSGDARIWLAIALLAVAGGAILAGIRLPLPIRLTQPGYGGRAILLLTWFLSMPAFLVCLVFYAQQYVKEYGPNATPAPKDPIAPFTFSAVVILFIVILLIARKYTTLRLRTRLASAFIGAIAAPFIFELPFDLIVMTRTYPGIPPDPALYRALFFVPLFLIDVTTLLLVRLSPMARLNRATFVAFALMLAVWAVWALDGYCYPASALPTTLNIVSKLLAFATALTVFLPQRSAPEQALPADAGEQAQSATTMPAAQPQASVTP